MSPKNGKQQMYELYVGRMGGTTETWANVCKLLAKVNPKTDSFEVYECVEQVEGEATKFGRQVICNIAQEKETAA